MVDPRGRRRSNSPAALETDFQQALRERGADGHFDEHTVEVISLSGTPRRVAHRIDGLFGATAVRLNFVVPDGACTHFAVYFDTVESKRARPKRYHGLIGDGDRFVGDFGRREIAASHFDCFVDFDGDGDLDLFTGGVEAFVSCYENVGNNRFVARGRLASGGKVLTLPHGRSNRSWVSIAFYDIDGDGDLDFFPSFGDGPDAGQIIFYRNTTREHGGQLTFTRVGPLQTLSGTPLAGGAQAGGWFPSITFVQDWDGDGVGPDALVGSANHCWLYRALAPTHDPRPLTRPSGTLSPSGGEGWGEGEQAAPVFADPVAVQAAGKDIVLVNPRFDCADIDGDGDLDLFASTQPGPVYWFKNIGTRRSPEFAPGQVIAWDGTYLIGDAHSGVKVADFDGDGLIDLVSGRFWERADLNAPAAPRGFGGFCKNVGMRTSPRFERRTRGGPFTEQFQICDAVRQNCVRAVDWDGDGQFDLLAGDTDGFIWFFRNLTRVGQDGRTANTVLQAPGRGARRSDVAHGSQDQRGGVERARSEPRAPLATGRDGDRRAGAGDAQTDSQFSVFADGEKLRAGGSTLTVAGSGGHARFDVSDWNNDGRKDLVVADGQGSVTLFLNHGRKSKPALAAGRKILADGKPISLGPRASVLVCDWNNDGRKDLVLADEKGYYFCKNIGTDADPMMALPQPILFGGKKVSYVRPNLGSFVDWDGDGKPDLIGCQFENSVRFYRNVGSGAPNTEPQFADPEGVVILQGESPQMISGVHVVDWNGDGDLDLLTGQGHGGSGLRFYEREWIEDELHGTHPVVKTLAVETKPGQRLLKGR